MAYSWVHAKKAGYTRDEKIFTLKEKIAITWEAKWALLVPIIILGGIYGGVFTPTEASAVAVIYGFFVGYLVYKDLNAKVVFQVLVGAARTTGVVLIILGTAVTFGRILTLEQVPFRIGQSIMNFSNNWIIIMLLINFLLLVVGCFMETNAAIMILTPILLPIAVAVGVDPVHFGIVMVVNLAIGFITPPLGVNLFVACTITKLNLEKVAKGIIGPLLVQIACLMLLTYVPKLSLFLPELLLK